MLRNSARPIVAAASRTGKISRPVPPEPQPAGNPIIELQLEGSPLVVRASLNGKSVRRALKVIAEHGPENVNVVLQGTLKPAAAAGDPFPLDAAGLAATPKVAKAEASPDT